MRLSKHASLINFLKYLIDCGPVVCSIELNNLRQRKARYSIYSHEFLMTILLKISNFSYLVAQKTKKLDLQNPQISLLKAL